jgi:transcriptional accessory protein Tex/SPT6
MFSFRSELTKKAEKSSIEVFATNLKNLLLASPVKGKCIMGIDPGFRNGCKLAVITSTGRNTILLTQYKLYCTMQNFYSYIFL